MKFSKMLLAAVVFFAAAGFPAFARNQQSGQHAEQETSQPPASPSPSEQTSAPAPDQPAETPESNEPADARPPVPQGTRLLVGLQDTLSTKEDKAGRRFVATTLEPITTAEGVVIPSGLQIRGHIDKVQSAGKTGRARMWLTFDDISTPRGWRPLVAQLIDAPGVHSIHVAYDHEGEIQAASVNRDKAMQAAAAGAFVGAATGVSNGKDKEAAMGAAIAAANAFMVAYGLGQEFTLAKGMKLELVIARPLHLGRT
ncbi:MAG: hypothetical protein ACRD59_18180 [Candidatus Acidiferrales bacterium]